MPTFLYRTSDGSKTELLFSVEQLPQGIHRAYVLDARHVALHAAEACVPGTRVEGGRRFVVTDAPARTLEEGKIAAALWADRMRAHARTGRWPSVEEVLAMHPDNAVYGGLRLGAPRMELDEAGLLAALSVEVHGQETALGTLARRVAQHLARRAARRPLTLMAIGPTGVGKTSTALALAEVLCGSGESASPAYSFLRLDMAEYSEAHRVSQLLGAPQGYVGYGDGAQLADALAASPRTLVLLDEIDKAHPRVLQALMNAMDAGRLSTPGRTRSGRELDFRQALLFFTSNLDATGILAEARGAPEDRPEVVDEVCRRRLRAAGVAPEFLGRIMAFLLFRPLSPEARVSLLARLIIRTAKEYEVSLATVEPSVVAHVAERAQGGRFGARPDEYLVDEILGPWLASAARTAPARALVLAGPPFHFVPCGGDDHDREAEGRGEPCHS